VNPVERVIRRVDQFQQHREPLAVLFAVVKKYGDDNAGVLVANLTYSAFLAFFPLLLIMVTVLGIVLAGHPGLQHDVRTSVLSQFPVIGTQLTHNITGLHSHTALSLIVGLLGLLWGATGLSQAGLFAMAQVWNVPGPQRPNYWSRLARSFGFLAAIGIGVAVSGFLAGVGTAASPALGFRIAGPILALAVNVLQFFVGYRVLTPKLVATRRLLPGAVIGGGAWTAVQAAAGYLVGHSLRHNTELYGTIAFVLGLLAWLYLGARVALYAAEFNVVLTDRLWPRSIVQPPLTKADEQVLDRQVTENQRRPEQYVSVGFRSRGRA
jgi:YihY family inner membrane protein